MKYSIFLFLLSSCSLLITERDQVNSSLSSIKRTDQKIYDYEDPSGTYFLKMSRGHDKKSNSFYAKRTLAVDGRSLDKPLEKSIAISDLGKLKTSTSSITILRPKISHFETWLDGVRHWTRTSLNVSKRVLEVNYEVAGIKSKKEISFPKGTGVFCYFNQFFDCIQATGFFKQSITKKRGTMNFHIIWDSYPHNRDIYHNIEDGVFNHAQLIYDGWKNKAHRFSLRLSGQSIFLGVTNDYKMSSFNWVSQGVKQVLR